MMFLLNHELEITTPKGLQLEDMMRVEDKLLNDFSWLQPAHFSIETIVFANGEFPSKKASAKITFVYEHEPIEQVVCVAFDKFGRHIKVCSNEVEAATKVYDSLCELNWKEDKNDYHTRDSL